MTDRTERIGDQTATLFRGGEFPIYVLTDGRFAVKWGNVWQIRRTLKAIEKIVTKERKSVKIFSVDNSISFRSRSIEIVDAVEMQERQKIVDTRGKKHFRGWNSYWYVYDEQIVEKLTDLEKRIMQAEKDFNAEFKKIMRKVREVHGEDSFKELLEEKGTSCEPLSKTSAKEPSSP